jgi:hypothetical protein
MNNGIKSFAYSKFENGKLHIEFDKLIAIHENEYGDYASIINIIDNLIEFVNKDLFNIDMLDNMIFTNNIKMDLIRQKKIYIENRYTKQFDGIDPWLLNKLVNLDGNNRLTFDDGLSDTEQNYMIQDDILISKLESILFKNKDKFERWCRLSSYSIDFCERVIKTYLNLSNKINKYKNELYEIDYNIKDMDWTLEQFDNVIKVLLPINDNKYYNILYSLLHGYGFNIVRRIEGSHLYLDVNNPNPDYVYEITKISKFSPVIDTSLDVKYFGEYLLYLSKTDTSIHNIASVTPKIIQQIVPIIYRPEKFNDINYNIDKQNLLIEHLVNSIDRSDDDDKNSNIITNDLITDYLTSIKEIKQDFLDNYDPNVLTLITNYDTKEQFPSMVNEYTKQQIQDKRIIKNQYGGSLIHSNIYLRYLINKYNQYSRYNYK